MSFQLTHPTMLAEKLSDRLAQHFDEELDPDTRMEIARACVAEIDTEVRALREVRDAVVEWHVAIQTSFGSIRNVLAGRRLKSIAEDLMKLGVTGEDTGGAKTLLAERSDATCQGSAAREDPERP